MKGKSPMNTNPESEVLSILEAIELSATCSACGKLSLDVLKASGPCPYCETKSENTPAKTWR
jgi:Zn finger protein HypA/HybF involved in hydrogenase expression